MPQFFTGRIFEVASRYNGPNWAEIRQMWEDRANRVAWEKDQQKVQQILGEANRPVAEARASLEAAVESGNAQAAKAARQRLSRAQGAFLDQSMMLAAQLAASGNPYAARAGSALQQSTALLAEQALGRQKAQQEQQAQEWARESDNRRYELEERKFGAEQGFQGARLGLEQQRLNLEQNRIEEERAGRAASAGRDQQRIDLERDRFEEQKAQGKREEERLGRREMLAAAELVGELRMGGMSDEAISKVVAQGTGGRLDLGELEGNADAVRSQDEATLKQIEEDMKVLEAAGEDTSELERQKQELIQFRVQDALRRAKRRSKGLPAEKGLGETIAELGLLLAPMGGLAGGAPEQ